MWKFAQEICLNGECHFSFEEKFVDTSCSWRKSGKRCVVKSTFDSDRLEIDIKKMKIFQFRFWHVIKLSIDFWRVVKNFLRTKRLIFFQSQNLMRWFFSTSKANDREFFNSKTQRVLNFLFQNHAFRKKRKCKICRFFGVKCFNMIFFVCKFFSVSGTF